MGVVLQRDCLARRIGTDKARRPHSSGCAWKGSAPSLCNLGADAGIAGPAVDDRYRYRLSYDVGLMGWARRRWCGGKLHVALVLHGPLYPLIAD